MAISRRFLSKICNVLVNDFKSAKILINWIYYKDHSKLFLLAVSLKPNCPYSKYFITNFKEISFCTNLLFALDKKKLCFRLSHNVVSSTSHLSRIWTLVVIGTNCTSSCKSNCHTTTTAPSFFDKHFLSQIL
jgi:hypothetical protein